MSSEIILQAAQWLEALPECEKQALAHECGVSPDIVGDFPAVLRGVVEAGLSDAWMKDQRAAKTALERHDSRQ